MNIPSLLACVFSDITKLVGSVEGLVRLDSAFCCHRCREVWLQALRSKQFTLGCYVDISDSNVLLWLLLKSAKASRVKFTFNINIHKKVSEFLRVCGSAIRSVYFVGGTKSHEMVLVALYCTHLTHIFLMCMKLTSAVKDLLLRNTELQEIYCDEVTSSETVILSNVTLGKLKQLTYYDVDCARDFIWSASAYSNSLQTVSWHKCSYNGSDLRALFRNCQQLRSFSLIGGRMRDDFHSVVRSSLVNLSLYNNDNLFDDQLLLLLKKLTSLRTLNIQHNDERTDLSLKHIAEVVGNKLKVLHVDVKTPANDQTELYLKIFSRKCTVLTFLNIDCEEKVLCSGKGTSLIACGCPALQTLVVNRCGAITKSSRELIRKMRPSLKILRHSDDTMYDILAH